MTNQENQKARNREKWLESEALGTDMTGKMLWCMHCKFCDHFKCTVDQKKRDAESLCAKAYNRMKRKDK